MSAPDRGSRVEALFHAARERDAGERAAFLDAACGADADLRREVESLLAQPTDDGFPGVPAGAAQMIQVTANPTSEPVSGLSGEAMTTLSPPSASRTPSDAGPGAHARLTPGQAFGPYRIVRLLGCGGMGDVYEAEQLEQGRRVALKVLSQRLTDPRDRARFLREGQLAASINHPNSVYIFGSEEIAGTPVIAMELLAGGTLKDRVREQGPLPPAETVDAILQIIAGLDAAQAGGILHRDIKPANCFIDRDGTVKVGDFGLSISTMARDETQLTRTGTFQGTPQFAAPEQLKGDPLDVRADIYAVGATLYYLLTGQPPFDDTDLMALLTRIATEVPRSPRGLQPRVPRGLATIVLRCLAKNRESRPATYAALDEALRPFGSTAPTQATIGLRFVAGVIDMIILSLPALPLNVALSFRAGTPFWLAPIAAAIVIAYYGIPEGLWGASLGKRTVGLQVTKANGQPAGVFRALWRALLFQTPKVVAWLPALFIGQRRMLELTVGSPVLLPATGLLPWFLIGLLFTTARRRNGFAAAHDLASRTRVVRRPERGVRSALDSFRAPVRTAGTGTQRYGPYDVVGTLGSTDVGELVVAFDPSLRRHVWIHTLQPGAVAVAPLVRDLNRPGRLRWLNGQRSSIEAWDAYESLDGAPLAAVLGAPRPWRVVRSWLLDLAREIEAGLRDGPIPVLTIDRVWITADGYAKLLDFRAPGVPPAAQEEHATPESAQTFLASVARSALDGSGDESSVTAAGTPDPLPLAASVTIGTLTRHGFATWSEVVTRTAALQQGPDRVGRGRRAVSLALCALVPVLFALMHLVMLPLISRVIPPDVMALNLALTRLSTLSQNGRTERAQERDALEVYVAGRFQSMIADPRTWETPATAAILLPRRALAERVVADHPTVSADDMAAATAALGPFLRAQEQRDLSVLGRSWTLMLLMSSMTLMFISLFGIVWAFVLRGGLLLSACGIAVVTSDGRAASRLRALSRGLVAWGLVGAGFWLGVGVGMAAGIGVGVLFLAGVVLALVHPSRGLQDRIAGTWLVPR